MGTREKISVRMYGFIPPTYKLFDMHHDACEGNFLFLYTLCNQVILEEV